MAGAFVQSAKTDSTGIFTNVGTVSLGVGVGTGNTLVLVGFGDQNHITGVSGLGATWTRPAGSPQLEGDAGTNVDLWVGTGASGGGTDVTVNFSGSTHQILLLAEFSGAPNVIASNGQADGAITNPVTADVVAQAVDEVAVASMFRFNAGSADVTGWTDTPAAFTTIFDVVNTAFFQFSYSLAYRITTATGSHHRAATITGAAHTDVNYGLILGTPIPPPPPSLYVVRQAVQRASLW